MGERRIRIVIQDGLPLAGPGHRRRAGREPQLDLVGQPPDREAALSDSADLQPDEILRSLDRPSSETKTVFVFPSDDLAALREALATGVGGYLTKQADEHQMTNDVVTVANGGTAMSAELQADLFEEKVRQTERNGAELSSRERAILELLADDRKIRGTAKELNLSESSIKAALQRIYSRLGVCGQAGAVAKALREGLIH